MTFCATPNGHGATESSLQFCHSLTCNDLGALVCPFKMALKMGALQYLYFEACGTSFLGTCLYTLQNYTWVLQVSNKIVLMLLPICRALLHKIYFFYKCQVIKELQNVTFFKEISSPLTFLKRQEVKKGILYINTVHYA